MKTFSQKPAEVTRTWYVIDATNVPLGRLSTEVARLLIGKHKSTYTPHTDGGDHVVVVNARNVALTGAKVESKQYYSHSGYPGNLKQINAAELLQKDAGKVIENAVKGMLPKNKLSNARMDRLKVFLDAEHNHSAQKPVDYKIGDK